MHIVFKSIDEWFEKDKDLKSKFKDTYNTIYTVAKNFAINMDEKVQKRIFKSANIEISEILLKQALIDAFDDLLRLTTYHPTKAPNPIKEMSYIVYWLVRHKIIRLVNEDIIKDEKLSDMFRTRLLFINESFCVNLLLNAAFEGQKKVNTCSFMFEEADKQLKYYKRYLLYYLVYRLDSPKSLEAMLLGCTIHPVWEVNPIIWSDPKDTDASY